MPVPSAASALPVSSDARPHALQLLDPWGKDALDLPAEEYLLLPLAGHRKLFAGGVPAIATE